MSYTQSIPVVLVLAGNDPSGGAGLQADIEALTSQGCHVAPVVTVVTVQDTKDIHDIHPIPTELIIRQAATVLNDLEVSAVKIGLIGEAATAMELYRLLSDWPQLPVVLDPILRSGGGTQLTKPKDFAGLKTLFPGVTVLTPNILEAQALAPDTPDLEACGRALVAQGCEFVLITGTHEDRPQVINRLFDASGLIESFAWERLPGSIHGSGCTLAASIAGLLAQGLLPVDAVHQAQEYTWQTLKHAYRVGHGQKLPNRLFWAKNLSA